MHTRFLLTEAMVKTPGICVFWGAGEHIVWVLWEMESLSVTEGGRVVWCAGDYTSLLYLSI